MPSQQPYSRTGVSTRSLSWTAKDVNSSGSSGVKLVEESFPQYKLPPQVLLSVLKEIFPSYNFKDKEPFVRIYPPSYDVAGRLLLVMSRHQQPSVLSLLLPLLTVHQLRDDRYIFNVPAKLTQVTRRTIL